MPRNVKTTGRSVSQNPGRAPFVQALTRISATRAARFQTIEPLFLRTMQDFDKLVAAGKTTQGDRQNGKGDFLNDVLALLLERCSAQKLHTRRGIPGLLFPKHSLDVAYPLTGTVELTIETKATGIPKHPGSPKQKAGGRPGSSDLDKRIKEAAFKDIDIKGEYARTQAKGGGATKDLTGWLRQTPPRNWLFLTVRVSSPGDLARAIDFAQTASRWFEDCGLYAYGHRQWKLSQPYESKAVPRSVELDRVLDSVCNALKNQASPPTARRRRRAASP